MGAPPEGTEPVLDFIYIDGAPGAGLISAQVEAATRDTVLKS